MMQTQLLRAMLAPSELEEAAAVASTPESTSAAWPPEAQRPFVDHLRKTYDFSQLLAIEVNPVLWAAGCLQSAYSTYSAGLAH